jgi:hypothetical protein
MKKTNVAFVVFMVFALAGMVAAVPKHNADAGRMLNGKVFDHSDHPVPDSVVYLTDMRTRVVKSYIVAADGAYRFPALTPNVDYEIYAQYKGQKSETKTLSRFDDRPQVNIDLKVDVSKN